MRLNFNFWGCEYFIAKRAVFIDAMRFSAFYAHSKFSRDKRKISIHFCDALTEMQLHRSEFFGPDGHLAQMNMFTNEKKKKIPSLLINETYLYVYLQSELSSII